MGFRNYFFHFRSIFLWLPTLTTYKNIKIKKYKKIEAASKVNKSFEKTKIYTILLVKSLKMTSFLFFCDFHTRPLYKLGAGRLWPKKKPWSETIMTSPTNLLFTTFCTHTLLKVNTILYITIFFSCWKQKRNILKLTNYNLFFQAYWHVLPHIFIVLFVVVKLAVWKSKYVCDVKNSFLQSRQIVFTCVLMTIHFLWFCFFTNLTWLR